MITKGERYRTRYGFQLRVLRVAHDGAWADLQITDQRGVTWRKRQPLQGGEFTYTVRREANT